MNVLVIGRGGREHAIVRQFAASPSVEKVYAAPGNDGMMEAERANISETDFPALARFVREHDIKLTFIGPEQPLTAGIADFFNEQGLAVFGPSQAAVRIESSKTFAKELMQRHAIPTAAHAVFTDATEAISYIKKQGAPIVVKADGLAAGKGVIVAETVKEAVVAVKEMLEDQKFGASGSSIVIEEFLDGEEFSFMSFVHDGHIFPMPLSQDHKRAYDGDRGPNTGGMGAYCPVPQIPSAIRDETLEKVVRPAVNAMAQEGIPFTGILYAGLILTADGPKVIEFNARFGDPETQVVLPLLKSDFGLFIDRLLAGEPFEPDWKEEAILGVVIAADGYPDSPQKGHQLPDLQEMKDVAVYHAGTKKQDNQFIGNGGRVLLVASAGGNIQEAAANVYQALGKQDWPGFFYRSDIGWRAK
ncbi:phosphoribosylamine--glycine ligase [Planococcus lenghuensis]|uniref:Phosphoribosylamine--glycine ligase n=1 Tax=Planococcus lenghuensis TaxID=2213202 RepID=A0A1Q2KW71_9BACL|nr:phosphoribosylamine--glycine ligase [Planococcus lenghuensis]AQQ52441.1 phosphoribosylamine--glycine ligase [Planococcus lenghuensis]